MVDLTKIPTSPGCYLYKDSEDRIIYVGKAKNIRKRVSQYFQNKEHDSKTSMLVGEVKDAEYIITDNEIEALLLEATLIRKHRPKYNIELKDGERYAYILITDEKFPRILSVRDKSKPGKYFGPYSDGTARRRLIALARKLFKIRVCNILPKKECLLYHIGLCYAPCIGKITQQQYDQNIKKAEMFLEGKTAELIRQLEELMQEESKKLNFEIAKDYRDAIFALQKIKQESEQKVSTLKSYDQDIIATATKDNKVLIQLFSVKKGVIFGKKEYYFDNQKDLLEQFITLYYSQNKIPEEIIIERKIEDINAITAYLKRLKGKKVQILIPTKGEKKKLLELVKKNAQFNLGGDQTALIELQKILYLQTLPQNIECIDISNIQGKHNVAGLVSFVNGVQDKQYYRRFKIKSFEGADDPRAIKEIVFRRYYSLKKENQKFPDLIVIDGGRAQLNAALEALKELEIKIPTIGLAKGPERKRIVEGTKIKGEEIYTPGLSFPLILDKNSEALKLLQRIRNEAHRFAISYHRKRRKIDVLGSSS